MRTTLVAVSIRMLATALLALAAAPAFAQEERIVATVPFDFVVGTQHLAAGKYIVMPLSEDPGVVRIEKANGRGSAVTMTIPVSDSNASSPAPKLVFETRGNEHVLARLVEADGNEREIVSRHAQAPATLAAAGERP